MAKEIWEVEVEDIEGSWLIRSNKKPTRKQALDAIGFDDGEGPCNITIRKACIIDI